MKSNVSRHLIYGLAASVLILATNSITANAATAYKEVAVKDGGMVTGKLTFEGAVPDEAVEKILITKNPDVCGTGEREIVWIDVKDGALRGAFVFIDKIAEGKPWTEPEGGFLIDQKDCRFRPWAQVIKRGPITIRNSDTGVLHNINTREMIGVEKGRIARRTMFNFGQPDPGDITENIKPRRSPFISINCEAHNFMFGFMLAPKHPYAVVVNEDGTYEIGDLPPGDYVLKAWHPNLGVQKVSITVPSGGTVQSDFAFSK